MTNTALWMWADCYWHVCAMQTALQNASAASNKGHHLKAKTILRAAPHFTWRSSKPPLIAFWIGVPPPDFPAIHIVRIDDGQDLAIHMAGTPDDPSKAWRQLDKYLPRELFVHLATVDPQTVQGCLSSFITMFRRYTPEVMGMWLSEEALKIGCGTDWSKMLPFIRGYP